MVVGRVPLDQHLRKLVVQVDDMAGDVGIVFLNERGGIHRSRGGLPLQL